MGKLAKDGLIVITISSIRWEAKELKVNDVKLKIEGTALEPALNFLTFNFEFLIPPTSGVKFPSNLETPNALAPIG